MDVAWSIGRAVAAAGFTAADVLLVVDNAVRPTVPSTEVGAASFLQRHLNSLHKSTSSRRSSAHSKPCRQTDTPPAWGAGKWRSSLFARVPLFDLADRLLSVLG